MGLRYKYLLGLSKWRLSDDRILYSVTIAALIIPFVGNTSTRAKSLPQHIELKDDLNELYLHPSWDLLLPHTISLNYLYSLLFPQGKSARYKIQNPQYRSGSIPNLPHTPPTPLQPAPKTAKKSNNYNTLLHPIFQKIYIQCLLLIPQSP